jgi:DNA-binding CsgD family transcriptional regulator
MTRVHELRFRGEEGNAKLMDSLGLTPREAEVLAWITQGKTNYEIGRILDASTGTVSKHVEHILAKLDVENRTAAAAIAAVTLNYLPGFASN